jgi:hypothetical protein
MKSRNRFCDLHFAFFDFNYEHLTVIGDCVMATIAIALSSLMSCFLSCIAGYQNRDNKITSEGFVVAAFIFWILTFTIAALAT